MTDAKRIADKVLQDRIALLESDAVMLDNPFTRAELLRVYRQCAAYEQAARELPEAVEPWHGRIFAPDGSGFLEGLMIPAYAYDALRAVAVGLKAENERLNQTARDNFYAATVREERAERAEAVLLALREENDRLIGKLCLVCGAPNDDKCPHKQDELCPCTFDPHPVEAAQRFLKRAQKAEAALAAAQHEEREKSGPVDFENLIAQALRAIELERENSALRERCNAMSQACDESHAQFLRIEAENAELKRRLHE